MSGDCCVLEYVYRDGGNYKTFGAIRLEGWSSRADAEIRSCLLADHQFVAEQVGVPALCREHWDSVGDGASGLDHGFHEFLRLRRCDDSDRRLPVCGELDGLLMCFRSAATGWDVTLSPNCEL